MGEHQVETRGAEEQGIASFALGMVEIVTIPRRSRFTKQDLATDVTSRKRPIFKSRKLQSTTEWASSPSKSLQYLNINGRIACNRDE